MVASPEYFVVSGLTRALRIRRSNIMLSDGARWRRRSAPAFADGHINFIAAIGKVVVGDAAHCQRKADHILHDHRLGCRG